MSKVFPILNILILFSGSVAVDDSLSRFRSSVDVSDMTGNISNSGFNSSGSGGSPRVLSMSNTQLRAQQVQSRTFLTGYYAPADLLTVILIFLIYVFNLTVVLVSCVYVSCV